MASNEGLWRIGGMYGEVHKPSTDGKSTSLLNEVIEISATAEINRIEVPIVGTDRTGYKPGRVTRTGSFRTQYIDSSWSSYVHDYLKKSLPDRRNRTGANRGEGHMAPFDLYIFLDDPDALGYEAWKLEGCLLWALPLGFSITDDVVDREWSFTYENEVAIATFKRTGAVANGIPSVVQTGPTSPQTAGGTATA